MKTVKAEFNRSGAVHEAYLNQRQINLIAAYEQYLDLPPQERVTEHLGSHYFLKQGADRQQVDLMYKCGLSDLKITESVFLSDDFPSVSCTALLDRFCPRLGIFLTNAGAYASGQLQGEWINLPTDSETLQGVFRKIGLADGGEYFITDYCVTSISDLTDCLGEHEDLNELNYLATKLREVVKEGNLEVFSAALKLGKDTGTVAELINLTENMDCYTLLPEVCDEESLGRYAVENGAYDLDAMGDLAQYIDYEALGRDIRINDGGQFTELGYIMRASSGISMSYESVEDIPQEYLIAPGATETAAEAMAENMATGMTMG